MQIAFDFRAGIREIGALKVKGLQQIKVFRRKLALLDWECLMLNKRTEDLEERTKVAIFTLVFRSLSFNFLNLTNWHFDE